MIYVALMRGINVGGNNKVDMKKLKATFESIGFRNVVTYINSVDNVRYVPGAILWNVEGENYSKSGMIKLVGTDLYRHMTIRNVNTFRRIHQIMIDAGRR